MVCYENTTKSLKIFSGLINYVNSFKHSYPLIIEQYHRIIPKFQLKIQSHMRFLSL